MSGPESPLLHGIVRHFDGRATTFRSSIAANGYSASDNEDLSDQHYVALTREIVRVMPLRPTDRLLEIGCGTGELLVQLTRHVQSVSAAEIAPGMADLARSRGLDVRLYDGVNLPFDNESFDRVVIFSVIINIPNIELVEALICDAIRVLKSGGTVLIGSTPHPSRSQFPTHEDALKSLNWRGRLRAKFGRAGQDIGCYSIPLAFFERFADVAGINSVRFYWAEPVYPGAGDRFHVVLEKRRP